MYYITRRAPKASIRARNGMLSRGIPMDFVIARARFGILDADFYTLALILDAAFYLLRPFLDAVFCILALFLDADFYILRPFLDAVCTFQR